MKNLIYNTDRTAYSVEGVRRTMTAGELISLLEQYDEDTPVLLGFDNRYTYGGFCEENFEENYGEGDAE